MVWYGMVWYGMVWYGMVWYGTVWYGMVWYGMVWYGMVWYGMVWYGIVYYSIIRYCLLTHIFFILAYLIRRFSIWCSNGILLILTMAQEENDSVFAFCEEDNYLAAGLSTTGHFCVHLNTLLELRMLYLKHARRPKWMQLWLIHLFLLLCHQQTVQLYMEWNDMVWYGMVWYGMVWYGMV
jgi:hypothetical protein